MPPVVLTVAEFEALAEELDAQAPRSAAASLPRVRRSMGRGGDRAAGAGRRFGGGSHRGATDLAAHCGGVARVYAQVRPQTRNVPLTHRGTVAELRRLMLRHPDSDDTYVRFRPGRTFGSHAVDWSRPLDTSNFLRNYTRPALERADILRMRLHGLRHAYAPLMLAAGFSASEISRWIGNASAATTKNV